MISLEEKKDHSLSIEEKSFQDWVSSLIQRTEQQDDAKEKILVTTLEVIAELGIEGLTIKTVSERLQMSTGIVHHHYQSKENLLYETFVYLVDTLSRQIIDILNHTDDPIERMKALIDCHFSDEMLSKSAANIWLYFWQKSLVDKKISRLLAIYTKRFIGNITSVMQVWFVDYHISREKALTFFALIHGLWIEYAITGGINSPNEAIHILQNYIQENIPIQYSKIS